MVVVDGVVTDSYRYATLGDVTEKSGLKVTSIVYGAVTVDETGR